MPSLVKLALLALLPPLAAANFGFHVVADDPGPWPRILSSIGLASGPGVPPSLFVLRNLAPGSAPQWLARADQGAFLVLEGQSELAESLGFHASPKRIVIRGAIDHRSPKLPIVWAKPVEAPRFEIPPQAHVFASERWEGAPLMAAIRRGAGAVLWLAVAPGEQGYERFPYLPQALTDLGLEPPFRSARLWAFFDSAYRSRVDLDYFAPRWRKAGIAALHVAAWHYFESEEANDAYLRRLIEACHRNGILVYAWLELPHVSERFWVEHPEWREKTALLQDAQLDWRKLMNLRNPAASEAVSKGVAALIGRFDWDGVNLAELYFESLEGASNPARFTPMNDDVRAEFRAAHGVDPLPLVQASAPSAGLKTFLDFRAELAGRQQSEWMSRIEALRSSKPDLDLVLTHVDDRFDNRMRDLIGADAARVLPLLDHHDFTFLIEDPATIWNLGPERYPQIAARYVPLTDRTNKLAIDINIVERYQDVYPTKQQTGVELFQLVHLAAGAFPQVALYFENSILAPDLPLLSAAAAVVDKVEQSGPRLVVNTRYGVGVPWRGPASVDGRVWPVRDQSTVYLPAGSHVLEHSTADAAVRLIDFNGNLETAASLPNGLDFSYRSSARAIAVLNVQPRRVDLDGASYPTTAQNAVLLLPKGQHVVHIEAAAPKSAPRP
jgi:hypothetical protein